MHKKSILFIILLFYIGCKKNGQAPPPPFPQVTLSASESSIVVNNTGTLYVNVANMKNHKSGFGGIAELYNASVEMVGNNLFMPGK